MPTPVTAKSRRKIPDYLVYEIMDGKRIYYRGYMDHDQTQMGTVI